MTIKKFILALLVAVSNLVYSNDSKIEINTTSAESVAHSIISFLPTSGPIGTRIQIAGTGFSSTTQVFFNNISASVSFIDSNTLQVIVPSSANTANQIITVSENGIPISFTTYFNLITNSGSCSNYSDIIISEVYDSNALNVWYIELYNPTNAAIDLNAIGTDYQIERYGDIGNPTPTRTIDLTGIIPPHSIFTLKIGNASPHPCNSISYDFVEVGAGINENDEIRLIKNGLPLDVVYCPNETGYSITRNTGSTGPSTTFLNTDWNTNLLENCSDFGIFNISNVLPTINTNPNNINGCQSSIDLSVTATPSGSGTLTYQWYYNNGISSNWVFVTSNSFSGITSTGFTTETLNLNGNTNSINGYQFYCSVTQNLTCTVSSNAATINFLSTIVPTFTQISAICSGDTFTLPTSSTNTIPITGTWHPSINNTTNTTYTFTPSVGQCATQTTMTVNVNPIATLSLTSNAGTDNQTICSGNPITPIQYTMGNGATSVNITGLPTGITSSTNGNIVTISGTPLAGFSYIINTIGGCGTVTLNGNIALNTNATLSLTSNAGTDNQTICSGNPITPIQYTMGNGATSVNITGLPTGITSSTNGNIVTISGTPLAGFSYIINTIGGCGTVTLNGNIALNTNATLSLTSNAGTDNQTICSGNPITPIQYTMGNGATSVNITGLPTGITSSTNGNIVTISGTPLAGFSYIINTIGGCGTVTLNGNIALNTNATLSLTSNAGTDNQTICINTSISPIQYTFGSGATGVNVTGLPSGLSVDITGSIVTISGTPIIASAATFNYTITATGSSCGSPVLLGSITLTNGILPIFNPVAPVCEGSTINIPSTSTNGIVGTWQLISSTPNDVTYEFTPNLGQCALNTQMTIVVHPLPTVIPSVTSQSFCSGGTTSINLTSNVSGVTFSWTATATSITGQSGSVIGSGATSINQTLVLNANQVAAGQVTYVIVAEANGCVGAPITVIVTVNPIPNVNVSSTVQTICSGEATNISFSGAINNTVYTWSVVSSVGVSGALNGVGTSINQILTTTGLSQGTVVYEVTPSLNGCPGTPQRITVTVNPVPAIFGSTSHRDLCSGVEPTNITVFTFNAATVFNWVVEPNGVSGASAGTATGSAILIEQQLTTTGNTRGYVDYIITPFLSGCSGNPITVRVYVNPLPIVKLTDGTICVDAAGTPYQTYTLNSGLDNTNYDFVWYFEGVVIPNSNDAVYIANAIGTYSVVATNSLTNCISNIESATITATNPATSFTIIQSEYFSEDATIFINVTGGNGTLLYQLDQGVLQESNVFTGVTGGPHEITVVDTQGCTYLTQDVLVIDYPKYFTPNGDGHNDTWNIIGMDQSNAKLYIFDRYGKLIKQLSPTQSSNGWDGTLNQEQLPSTDYWFTLDYTENGVAKQFKAHFSLNR